MRIPLLFAALVFAAPAAAQEGGIEAPEDFSGLVESALTQGVRPAFAGFAAAAGALEKAAAAHCSGTLGDPAAAQAAKAAYAAAYDAWMDAENYRFGPAEEASAALKVNFWPDPKNAVGRFLTQLRAAPPADQASPAFVAGQSAAVQGFPALERLYSGEGDPCPLSAAIAGNLADFAGTLFVAWEDPDQGWAALMRAPGPENPVYQSPDEAIAAFYRALDQGLEILIERRLARALDRPRLAEAWRSARSVANMRAQIAGLHRLYAAAFARFSNPALSALWREAEAALAALPEPGDGTLPEAEGKAAQEKVRSLRQALRTRLVPALGIGLGFNSLDGD